MMPPVAEVLAKAKSVFAFQTTDIIDHLASLLIERGAFVSGCGGSRTRRNSWLSQWTNSNTSCDSFPDYRSANQAWGGRTPFADAESAVSGSHKPRPPKFKLPGLSCPVALGAGARCPRSATTDTVGAGSTAGGANFARPLRRLAAAVVVGLKDGAHPLSAEVSAIEKS